MIILKVTKNHGFTFSLEKTFLEKPQGESNRIDSPPPSPRSLFKVNSVDQNILQKKMTCSGLKIEVTYLFKPYLNIPYQYLACKLHKRD